MSSNRIILKKGNVHLWYLRERRKNKEEEHLWYLRKRRKKQRGRTSLVPQRKKKNKEEERTGSAQKLVECLNLSNIG